MKCMRPLGLVTLAALCCCYWTAIAAQQLATAAQCPCLNAYRPVCGGSRKFINLCEADCAGVAHTGPVNTVGACTLDGNRNEAESTPADGFIPGLPGIPDICTCSGKYEPVCAGREYKRWFPNGCEAMCAGFDHYLAAGAGDRCPPTPVAGSPQPSPTP